LRWFSKKDRFEEIEALLLRIIETIESLRIPVFEFVIMPILGENMNINPGQSTTLTAAPLDASGNPTTLPTGDVPQWSVEPSGPALTPSADGLTLGVSFPTNAAPGDYVFNVADGIIKTATGTITLTIPSPGPNPVASFAVTASTPV
jgi:hypothetical protein